MAQFLSSASVSVNSNLPICIKLQHEVLFANADTASSYVAVDAQLDDALRKQLGLTLTRVTRYIDTIPVDSGIGNIDPRFKTLKRAGPMGFLR